MALSSLSDGFIKICIDPSLNVFGEGCRILVEGQMTSAGTAAADKVVCVTSDRDLAQRFGLGSVLTESLRRTFETCPNSISIYALPRNDAPDAVAAVDTITITGPATSDGRIDLYLGDDDYSISVRISAGDTAAQIAALIASAIPANFPYTKSVVGAVITLTARNAGTIGNHLDVIYSNLGTCNGLTPGGVTITFAHGTRGSVNPSPSDYATVVNECCFAAYSLASDDTDWQDNLRDWIRSAWDCDKPQCFGHGYVFNKGTLSAVLASGDNSAELSRMALPATYPILPYLQNAAFAALSACSACTNPELSIQGQTYGLLRAVSMPTNCAPTWEFDEVKQLQAMGFVVTGALVQPGLGQLANPYVFNDVTNYLYDENGKANATYRDASSRRMAAYTADQLAIFLQRYNGLSLFKSAIKPGVLGTNVNLILSEVRKYASSNVGVLFSEFDDINNDIKLGTDFDINPPCVGKPGVLHLNMVYRPPVRISQFNVGLKPALFDNCPR